MGMADTVGFLDSTAAQPAHKVRVRDLLSLGSFLHTGHTLIHQSPAHLLLVAYCVAGSVKTDARHNSERKTDSSLSPQIL